MSLPAARLAGVTKRYHSNVVLGPVDLELEAGRIYGLIGENGAGKSTLIRILMGLSKPSAGTVELWGERDAAGLRRARASVGYVPDTGASYPQLSATDNLKARCLEWGLDQRQAPHLLDMVGLADTGKKKVRSFSLGMRRRLDLAIALLGNPRMLVLDEPTNGLDPLGTVEIRQLLRRLNEERATTILISSHNLSELHQTATDFLMLSHGRLIAEMSALDIDKLSGGNLEELYMDIVLGRFRGGERRAQGQTHGMEYLQCDAHAETPSAVVREVETARGGSHYAR
ncbi:MAG: ABC transporter ATP-binding protein [Coriobacteriaceae bacterium]|nr:ABC transporter ATP-binding protein [Coriobacteriaceae bacterium]